MINTNKTYAKIEFFTLNSLTTLFKQQSKTYFLRHKWDQNILSLLSWTILILKMIPSQQTPLILIPKTYTITITHNIPSIPCSTKLKTYLNCKSPQLRLIKFSLITPYSPNLKIFLRSLYKRGQPPSNICVTKKLKLYLHANFGFPIHGTIFPWSSHVHKFHSFQHPITKPT
jgi:hypothetical protein